MRIAICDDDRETVRQVTEAIDRFSAENPDIADIEYREFYSAEDAIDYYKMNGNTFDVLITDIEFHDTSIMNGIQLATRVRNRDEEVSIFFLTSHKHYAVECFKPRPADFWEKPLKYEDLVYGLGLAVKEIRRNSEYIDIVSGRITKRIKCSSIAYIEKTGRKTLLHTVSGDVHTNKSLSEFEDLLSPKHFVRIYQSFIVNIARIEQLHGNKVKLEGIDKELEVGRVYIGSLKRKYMRYREGM